MNIKELLEKQKEEFEKKFCADYTPWGSEEEILGVASDISPTLLQSFFKQSLLQFVDYLIEDLRGKKIPNLSAMSTGSEFMTPRMYKALEKNKTLDDQITTLLSIKKEIESL